MNLIGELGDSKALAGALEPVAEMLVSKAIDQVVSQVVPAVSAELSNLVAARLPDVGRMIESVVPALGKELGAQLRTALVGRKITMSKINFTMDPITFTVE